MGVQICYSQHSLSDPLRLGRRLPLTRSPSPGPAVFCTPIFVSKKHSVMGVQKWQGSLSLSIGLSFTQHISLLLTPSEGGSKTALLYYVSKKRPLMGVQKNARACTAPQLLLTFEQHITPLYTPSPDPAKSALLHYVSKKQPLMGVQKTQGVHSAYKRLTFDFLTTYITATRISHHQQTTYIYGVWIFDLDRVLVISHSPSSYPDASSHGPPDHTRRNFPRHSQHAFSARAAPLSPCSSFHPVAAAPGQSFSPLLTCS